MITFADFQMQVHSYGCKAVSIPQQKIWAVFAPKSNVELTENFIVMGIKSFDSESDFIEAVCRRVLKGIKGPYKMSDLIPFTDIADASHFVEMSAGIAKATDAVKHMTAAISAGFVTTLSGPVDWPSYVTKPADLSAQGQNLTYDAAAMKKLAEEYAIKMCLLSAGEYAKLSESLLGAKSQDELVKLFGLPENMVGVEQPGEGHSIIGIDYAKGYAPADNPAILYTDPSYKKPSPYTDNTTDWAIDPAEHPEWKAFPPIEAPPLPKKLKTVVLKKPGPASLTVLKPGATVPELSAMGFDAFVTLFKFGGGDLFAPNEKTDVKTAMELSTEMIDAFGAYSAYGDANTAINVIKHIKPGEYRYYTAVFEFRVVVGVSFVSPDHFRITVRRKGPPVSMWGDGPSLAYPGEKTLTDKEFAWVASQFAGSNINIVGLSYSDTGNESWGMVVITPPPPPIACGLYTYKLKTFIYTIEIKPDMSESYFGHLIKVKRKDTVPF